MISVLEQTGRQQFLHRLGRLQVAGGGKRPGRRPVGEVEQVARPRRPGRGDHLQEAGEGAEDGRELIEAVPHVELRDPPDQAVDAAHRQHRRERAEVRRADHHQPGDVGIVHEAGAGDQPAHAVRDKVHPLVFLLDAVGELSPERLQALAPVIRREVGVIAGDPELQLEAQIGEQEHADRLDATRARQRELVEPPPRDVDGIEPDDVGRQKAPRRAEPRSHDPRQDQHAVAAADRAPLRHLRQAPQLLILGRAEKVFEDARILSGQQAALDLLVRQAVAVDRDLLGGPRARRLGRQAPRFPRHSLLPRVDAPAGNYPAGIAGAGKNS